MRRWRGALAIGLVLAGPAMAEEHDLVWRGPSEAICQDNRTGAYYGCGSVNNSHAKTGDADLDRAVAICDRHTASSFIVTDPPTTDWPAAYDMCHKVMTHWKRSEAAKRQEAAKQKEAADKAWLDSYTAGLGQ
jgi:hypothetical protein